MAQLWTDSEMDKILFYATDVPVNSRYLRVSLTSLKSKFEPRHDKINKMSVRPAMTQISMGIRPVWSESSLCAQWVAKDPRFLHADSEDSDQTGPIPRLIWVFAGRTITFFVLSCRGSLTEYKSGPQIGVHVTYCGRSVHILNGYTLLSGQQQLVVPDDL